MTPNFTHADPPQGPLAKATRYLHETRLALVKSVREEPIKIACLVALTLNTTILDFLASYSLRIGGADGLPYNVTSVILLSEIGKVIVSGFLATRENAASLNQTGAIQSGVRDRLGAYRAQYLSVVRESIFGDKAYLMAVPAALYVLQNNLRFVALTTLDVATFQVTAQLKILTTALFTILLLNKILNSRHWGALIILVIGVATVQITPGASSEDIFSDSGTATASSVSYFGFPSALVGFLANLIASILSGLAGVYFEKILKSTTTSLWIRQLQLSAFSILPALVVSISTLRGDVRGFFKAFTFSTWAVIAMQVYVGLIAALVIKHTDNIMKILASSASIILCALLQIPIFGRPITVGLAVGSCLVVASIWMYGMAPAPIQRENTSDDEDLILSGPQGGRWKNMTEEEADEDFARDLLDDDELAISPEVPLPRPRG